ncbi:MAG: class I SAM-dependent methyltransferase [Pseudomonadota bacterium]
MNTRPKQGGDTLPDGRLDRIGWAYKVASETSRARARFDAWAEDYDKDVHDLLGWRGPDATIDYVLKYVAKDADLLDAGSGTGLMGALMGEHGYTAMVGTDISDKMLAIAREKGIYHQDFQADLTKPLPVENEAFDCVVSVGVSGYMIAETIAEFVRLLRSGGHIIYTISDSHFEEHGFQEVVDGLVDEGRLAVVEKGEAFATLPKSDPDHLARVHVYRKM